MPITLNLKLDDKFLICMDCGATTTSGSVRRIKHQTDCPAMQGFDGLTARQKEVAVLLSMGNSAKDIARLLTISPKTVETHKCKIYSKLQVSGAVLLTRVVMEYERAHELPN